MSTYRLSNVDRNKLRRAIGSHVDWRALKLARGLGNTGTLSSSRECIELCIDLGIDWKGVVYGSKSTDGTPRQPAPDALPECKGEEGEEVKPAKPARVRNQDEVKHAGVTFEDVETIATRVAKKEIARHIAPVEIERVIYETVEGSRVPLPDLTHAAMPDLLGWASVGVYTMLVGPAGSGKSHACAQAAEIVGRDFYFQSMALEVYDLTGVVYPNGTYVPSPFVEAFQKGGIWLGDELDRWQRAALVGLNAALAQGKMYLPNNTVAVQHADFHAIGACNTYGRGGTHEYEAEPLDQSTLSRFPAKVAWEYDEALEHKFAGDCLKSQAWTREVQAVRQIAKNAAISLNADPRTMSAGIKALDVFPIERIRAMTYQAGLDADQVKLISMGLTDLGVI